MALAVEPRRDAARRRKTIAAMILGIPVSLVVLFAVGEGIGGEAGWWGHLIQLALALAFAAVAWTAPRIGGPMLVAAGLALATWVVSVADNVPAALTTIGILVLPMVVSGVLFTLAGFSSGRHANR